MKSITNGDNGENVLVLAHGAGAPMDSRFMDIVAGGLANSTRASWGRMRQEQSSG